MLTTLQSSLLDAFFSTGEGSDFTDCLSPTHALSAVRQMAIYRNNIRGAHIEALRQIYPVIKKIVGENYFQQMASAYFARQASSCSDLNRYGEAFPSFIDVLIQQQTDLQDFKYLADLAVLEWCRHNAYFAEDDSFFDYQTLASLIQKPLCSDIIFYCSYSLHFIRSPYPLDAIYTANTQTIGTHDVPALEAPAGFIVYRKEHRICVQRLTTDLFDVLFDINGGMALSNLFARHSNDHVELDKCISRFIDDGIITGFNQVTDGV